MCGIVGILIKNGDSRVSEETVNRMKATFPYRGPDDSGVWVNPARNVAIGHVRLSIIDTSSAGWQPMGDESENLRITYNGEVYNYIELRKELEAIGYTFFSKTDTEVILVAYNEWKENCLQRFNGMFAFGIWNEREKTLFLARDRLGIKPLYYYEDSSVFCFASEPKAILVALNNTPPVDMHLIDAYMSFGYVPGENTLFRGIKRLLPGHWLTVSEKSCVYPKRYWKLNFQNCQEDRGLSFYTRRCRELLEDAVDLRLRSDVPLGIFLSGGLDSSTVVGLLAPRVSKNLHTFSVAYNFGPEFDETPYARLVAERFNTNHHEIYVTPGEFCDFIPKYVALMDEPVAEAAAISLYYVSNLAKEYVKVVLSGEGADEIFAGYDLYWYMTFIERYRQYIGPGICSILGKVASIFLPVHSKLRKYLVLGSVPLERRYKGISMYEEEIKNALYQEDFKKYISSIQGKGDLAIFIRNLLEECDCLESLNKMLFFDIHTWLVDDLLIKADRMSMGASLELRVPFLDHRLVEFAATIPPKWKLNGTVGKYLLREMMKNVLPPQIIKRSKKGFPTPLRILFRRELYDYACDILLSRSSMIYDFFERDKVESLLHSHAKGKIDWHRVLWQLVVLEEWLQKRHYPSSFTSKCIW